MSHRNVFFDKEQNRGRQQRILLGSFERVLFDLTPDGFHSHEMDAEIARLRSRTQTIDQTNDRVRHTPSRRRCCCKYRQNQPAPFRHVVPS